MIDIQTYLNRITSQHKTKPNFMALLTARLQPFIDLAECLGTFDAEFDLDNAAGNQLDIIGKYVGVDRLLNFQPVYAPSAILDDTYYRMLLKVRISQNNWDGTTEGIQKIWGDVFPEYTIVIVDKQDMTINIRITGLDTPFISELIQHGYIVPKSMGVLVNFFYVQHEEHDVTMYIASAISTSEYDEFVLEIASPPLSTDMFMALAITELVRDVFTFEAVAPSVVADMFIGVVVQTDERAAFSFSLETPVPNFSVYLGSAEIIRYADVFDISIENDTERGILYLGHSILSGERTVFNLAIPNTP
jgi:hypothetical protein